MCIRIVFVQNKQRMSCSDGLYIEVMKLHQSLRNVLCLTIIDALLANNSWHCEQ